MVRGDTVTRTTMEYIWVLDFTNGKVYRYDINSYATYHPDGWNPDNETCEDFLIEKGHKLQNCEWMLTETSGIIK